MADELGLSLEILDLRSLAPPDHAAISEAVRKTHRVLILHEATMTGGIGAEVSAYITEYEFEHLDAPVMRVASLDTPVPFASHLEEQFLPVKRLKETNPKSHSILMDLENILSVTGLSGLYKLVTTRSNGIVIEDLDSGKKTFISMRKHQFTPLESIGIYTYTDVADIREVFQKIDDLRDDIPPTKAQGVRKFMISSEKPYPISTRTASTSAISKKSSNGTGSLKSVGCWSNQRRTRKNDPR